MFPGKDKTSLDGSSTWFIGMFLHFKIPTISLFSIRRTNYISHGSMKDTPSIHELIVAQSVRLIVVSREPIVICQASTRLIVVLFFHFENQLFCHSERTLFREGDMVPANPDHTRDPHHPRLDWVASWPSSDLNTTARKINASNSPMTSSRWPRQIKVKPGTSW